MANALRNSDSVKADLLAFDEQGVPVLLVEIKGMRPVPESVTQLLDYMRASTPPIPFGMLVDPDRIQVYRFSDGESTQPVLDLSTRDIMRPYDPGIDDAPLYVTYLTGLIEVWLADLDYHWKFASPPASESLHDIGLLARLANGEREREVRLACPALH